MKNKEPEIVQAARDAVAAKEAALKAAQDSVVVAQKAYGEALAALRDAQEKADSGLPQCRCVSVSRYRGNETEASRMVILRKTPGGLLVTRRAGDPHVVLFQFKWSEFSGVYREKTKQTFYSSGHLELRDVPPQFIPKGEAA
jgi:hypothetical protein